MRVYRVLDRSLSSEINRLFEPGSKSDLELNPSSSLTFGQCSIATPQLQ